MQTTPATFACAEDHTNLTDRVLEELDAQIPVAFGRRPKQFRVVVQCPGGEQPHDVVCTGDVTY